MAATSTKREEPVGGGLYIDQRGKSKPYLWRGRVGGKHVALRLKHPSGATATVTNMTVSDAKRIAKDIAADAVNGGNRFFAHIDAKPKAGDFTVRQAWAEYLAREGSKRRARTVENKVSQFRRFIEPRWGDKPVRAITTKDCKTLLGEVRRAFEARELVGAQVNVLHSNLAAFFRFCAKRDEFKVENNPMAPLDERPVDESLTRRGSRFLDETELKLFFKAAAVVRKERPRAVDATETLLRASARRNEVFTAKWSDIGPDGLLIPADKAKNGAAILIPLTDGMRALIGDRPDDATDDTRIFDQSVSWLSRAIDDIRAEMGTGYADKKSPLYFTMHDMRDTMMTLMETPKNEWHQPIFPMETRDGMLNHRPSGVGAKRYHGRIQDPYWLYGARKAAGEYWNDWLDRLQAEA